MSHPMNTIEEAIDELLRKYFKDVVTRSMEQHDEHLVEFAERSKIVRAETTAALTALFRKGEVEAEQRGYTEGITTGRLFAYELTKKVVNEFLDKQIKQDEEFATALQASLKEEQPDEL